MNNDEGALSPAKNDTLAPTDCRFTTGHIFRALKIPGYVGFRQASWGREYTGLQALCVRRTLSYTSRQLEQEFGSGFGRTNLLYMMQFVEMFPNFQIVHTLSGQLGWSHFKEILPIKDRLERSFMLKCADLKSGVCGRCGSI